MSKKKVLVLSETIFSDRLFDTMGFGEMYGTAMVAYNLDSLNAFEKGYSAFVKKSAITVFRWKMVRFWRQVARYVAPAGCDTTSLDDHYDVDCLAWSWRKRFLIWSTSRVLRKSAFLRRLMLALVTRLMPTQHDLMEREFGHFDAVIVFSLGNLRSAVIPAIAKFFQSRGKPVIAYIQSWDNPTTKGYRCLRPDRVLCWTELMRNEVASYMDVGRECSIAVGVPIFDDVKQIDRREARHVLLATKSPKSYQHNCDLAALIGAFAKSLGLRFTVRMHPLSLDNAFADELNRMKSYADDLGFDIIYPKHNDNGAILSRDYDRQAAQIFQDIDIFVSIFSTMNLEAVNAGKATINIDFELGETQSDTGRHDIVIDRRQIHNQRALSYGGIRNVQSVGALYQAILACCDPQQATEAHCRAKLIEAECRPIYDPRHVDEIISETLEK